ncbi:hypothetical protein Q4610_13490 [Sphingobium sp. HBC34]|uniref:Uncharacterized protein n=1 Tax=Sphingobium cyanobacteriorum TaxID=3063954 RepID=A0ABT8ZNG6_9SPHN|nr:hypothetical protein [Sphingobium sp. HBC34]MDO7836060.1 hypothetical protein [Sphingobium sp. HBC34]
MATRIEGMAVGVREHRLFTGMALLIAMTVIGGFGSFALRGMVDVAAVPWWVHVHGVTLIGWTLLFLAQTLLVAGGRVHGHRQLGWAAVGLACFMVPWGVATSILAVEMGRVPPFFTPGIFLLLGPLDMLTFALLAGAGVALRRRGDWHKRLMLCGTIALIEPAFGRLLPMPLLGAWAGACATLMQLFYIGIAACADRRANGVMHGAYGWAAAAMVVRLALVELLGRSAWAMGTAAALMAG